MLVDRYFLVIHSYLFPKYQEIYDLNNSYTTSKTRSVGDRNLLPVTPHTRTMTRGKDVSEAKGMNQIAKLFSDISQYLRTAKHLKSLPQQESKP